MVDAHSRCAVGVFIFALKLSAHGWPNLLPNDQCRADQLAARSSYPRHKKRWHCACSNWHAYCLVHQCCDQKSSSKDYAMIVQRVGAPRSEATG
jgi:hypothetical protein